VSFSLWKGHSSTNLLKEGEDLTDLALCEVMTDENALCTVIYLMTDETMTSGNDGIH
jgi:hypothetical protein